MQTLTRSLALLAIAATTIPLHAGDRPGLRSTTALLEAPVATSTIVLDRAAHRTLTGYAHEETHELGLVDLVGYGCETKEVVRRAIGRDWRIEDVYTSYLRPCSRLSAEQKKQIGMRILGFARRAIKTGKYRKACLAARFVTRIDVAYGVFDDRPKIVLADLAHIANGEELGPWTNLLPKRQQLQIHSTHSRQDPLFAPDDQGYYGNDECPDDTDAPDHFAARVVAVEDLDRVTLQSGNQKVTRALAGLLPFSQWPSDLSPDDQKLRDALLKSVRKQLVGREFLVPAGCFDESEAETAIELLIIPQKSPNQDESPAETSANLMLLKQGVTVADARTTDDWRFGAGDWYMEFWMDQRRRPNRRRQGIFASRRLNTRLTRIAEQHLFEYYQD